MKSDCGVAAVQARDLAHQSKAKACAARVAAKPVKRGKDALALGLRDAIASIHHVERDSPARAPKLEFDSIVRPSEPSLIAALLFSTGRVNLSIIRIAVSYVIPIRPMNLISMRQR